MHRDVPRRQAAVGLRLRRMSRRGAYSTIQHMWRPLMPCGEGKGRDMKEHKVGSGIPSCGVECHAVRRCTQAQGCESLWLRVARPRDFLSLRLCVGDAHRGLVVLRALPKAPPRVCARAARSSAHHARAKRDGRVLSGGAGQGGGRGDAGLADERRSEEVMAADRPLGRDRGSEEPCKQVWSSW